MINPTGYEKYLTSDGINRYRLFAAYGISIFYPSFPLAVCQMSSKIQIESDISLFSSFVALLLVYMRCIKIILNKIIF